MLAQYRSTRSDELSPKALDADATEEKKAEYQAKLRTAAMLNAALPEALPSLMKFLNFRLYCPKKKNLRKQTK